MCGGGANGDLESLIYVYGQNKANRAIGVNGQVYEMHREQKATGFRRCEIEVRWTNSLFYRRSDDIDTRTRPALGKYGRGLISGTVSRRDYKR